MRQTTDNDMTKTKYAIGLLVLCTALLWFCQTKNFKSVKVTGRLFHSSTQQPFSDSEVALYADDALSAKDQTRNSIQLTTTTTNAEGFFILKANASKKRNYYLRLMRNAGLMTVDINGGQGFEVADNSTKDLGDIFVNW
jgi:hypothetical protein